MQDELFKFNQEAAHLIVTFDVYGQLVPNPQAPDVIVFTLEGRLAASGLRNVIAPEIRRLGIAVPPSVTADVGHKAQDQYYAESSCNGQSCVTDCIYKSSSSVPIHRL
jgi:hypothetical protein